MEKPTNTSNIRYVDPNSAGGDGTSTALSGAAAAYASLNAALSAQKTARSGITPAGGLLFLYRTNGGAADTTPVTVANMTWTATDANPLWIEADAGYIHAGIWDDTKARLVVTNPATNALNLNTSYTAVVGLQVKVTDTSTNQRHGLATSTAAPTGVLIDRCLIVGDVGSNMNATGCHGLNVGNAGSGITVRNSIIYGWLNGAGKGLGISGVGTGTAVAVENCDVAGCYRGLSNGSATSFSATNCYLGGNSNVDVTGTITYTACVCEDNITGATGLTKNVAYSTSSGAYFGSVTPGNASYLKLTASTPASIKGGGINLSPSWGHSLDITGAVRSAWDVGAFAAAYASGYTGGWVIVRG